MKHNPDWKMDVFGQLSKVVEERQRNHLSLSQMNTKVLASSVEK